MTVGEYDDPSRLALVGAVTFEEVCRVVDDRLAARLRAERERRGQCTRDDIEAAIQQLIAAEEDQLAVSVLSSNEWREGCR